MTSSLLAYAALGISSLVLAGVFLHFYRLYQRHYLWLWFLSWSSLTVYALAAGISLRIAVAEPLSPYRTATSIVSLVATYFQVTWLIAGAAEIANQRRPDRRILRATLLLAVLFAAGSVMIGVNDPAAAQLRLFWRLGLRNLLTGIAFLVSSVFLLRALRKHPGSGVRMVIGAFAFYGLLLTLVSSVSLAPGWLPESYTNVLRNVGSFDLVAVTLIGIGLVMWLLEEEQDRLLRTLGRIEELETLDPLTGLENRTTFLQRLEGRLQLAVKTRQLTVVGVVDIDRFRDINDALGHNQGDEILRRFADCLTDNSRETDLMARLASDQFAFALGGFSRLENSKRVATQFLEPLKFPFDLGTRQVQCQVSVGLAIAPSDGGNAEEILRHAHAARRKVKAAGGNDLLFYSSSLTAHTADDLDFERELRKAARSGQFFLRYQPIVSYPSRSLLGVEALLRWQHPSQGELGPAQFLPLAANLGLMQKVDRWVLAEACRQASSWARDGETVRVSVNLSASSLNDPELPDRVRQLLSDLSLAPLTLRLEITEHDAVRDLETGVTCLAKLRELGVSVCIDDFGVGYSSFSLLDRLPIDTLKIDKSFVQRAARDRREATIVSAMISMANTIGLSVIGEGVEDELQARLLAAEGCTVHQGYLYHRPLFPDAILRLAELAGEVPRAPAVVEGGS